MHRGFLLVLLLLAIGACAYRPGAEEQATAANMMLDENMVAVDSGPAERFEPSEPKIDYFPPSLGEPSLSCRWGEGRLQPILSDFERRWYSHALSIAGEPSLFLESKRPTPGARSLRFTWLPSFHHPVIVRIETAPSGQARLLAASLSGAGGYDPGTSERRIDRMLTSEESRRLGAILAQARLFQLPLKVCDGGCDGAEWIFEGVDESGYHYLDRWSPEKGAPHKVGLFLLSLTGWQLEMIY
jgi:hypothetical protein